MKFHPKILLPMRTAKFRDLMAQRGYQTHFYIIVSYANINVLDNFETILIAPKSHKRSYFDTCIFVETD
jgi:hypothetical protein